MASGQKVASGALSSARYLYWLLNHFAFSLAFSLNMRLCCWISPSRVDRRTTIMGLTEGSRFDRNISTTHASV